MKPFIRSLWTPSRMSGVNPPSCSRRPPKQTPIHPISSRKFQSLWHGHAADAAASAGFPPAGVDGVWLRCALTNLPLVQLLEAAHIVADSKGGSPRADGIAMSTFHHTAYESNLMGIDPDGRSFSTSRCAELATIRCSAMDCWTSTGNVCAFRRRMFTVPTGTS
jgi:hypothetical protein